MLKVYKASGMHLDGKRVKMKKINSPSLNSFIAAHKGGRNC